jgi:DNA-binding transcriptional ArsR family regulator
MNTQAIRAADETSAVCEIEFVNAEKVASASNAMKSIQAVALLAETFKALGDPTRIRISFALAKEELCVCDLANLIGVSQSAVSHSLRVLRQLKLVKFRKEGKIAYYTLDDEHIEHLLDEGFRHVDEILG